MSGHSKWHSIKHKKGALDAKRGRLFTKLIKEIVVAARMGGGDIDGNPRLRTAVQAARDANLPKDNIDRAVKKGAGDLTGVSYEDFTFEGYGAAGVAVIVEGSTDNRQRTTPELRHAFAKHGGNLGETGCVAYMFDRKGVIMAHVPEGKSEDSLMETVLDAGAEDFDAAEGMCRVVTAMPDLYKVREALEAQGLKIESANLEYVSKSEIKVEGKEAERVLKLINILEDHDDVSRVSANYDIAPELIEQFS